MTFGAEGLKPGSWALWSIGMVTVFARMASRRLAVGAWRKLQLDDYLMMLCAVTFTGVAVCSNQVAINGSNYAPDDEIAGWTPQQVRDAEWGSKMLLALEEFMLATVWLVKACLLLLYARLTSGLAEALLVKIVAVYCAVGYLVIQILYLGVWCRPIYNYWAVPVPEGHTQCKTYLHHMITVTVFHVSSDLIMLLIPVPMIARARLPLLRKIILCVLFSLGLLVVLVAILNRYYNFTVENSLVFLIWYNGEASTAVMVANIPFLWTLLRRIFALDAWSASSRRSRNASGGPGAAHGPGAIGAHQRLDDDYDLSASRDGGGLRSHASRASRASLPPSTQHSALDGVDPMLSTISSMERMTARQSGGTSLQQLHYKHSKASSKASSGGGADTDIEAGLK